MVRSVGMTTPIVDDTIVSGPPNRNQATTAASTVDPTLQRSFAETPATSSPTAAKPTTETNRYQPR